MYHIGNVNKQDVHDFISKYSSSLQDENTSYSFLGVYESNKLVALLEYSTKFAGYGTDDKREHVHIKSLYKIPGIKHGIFKCVLNYINRYLIRDTNTKIYLEAYESKLVNMYKTFGFRVYNKNYPHFMVLEM